MGKAQIVSNGIEYRIKLYKPKWWNLNRWVYLYRYHPDCGEMIVEFCNYKDAQQGLQDYINREKANMQGFQPVKDK